jgi:hypothetical protein
VGSLRVRGGFSETFCLRFDAQPSICASQSAALGHFRRTPNLVQGRSASALNRPSRLSGGVIEDLPENDYRPGAEDASISVHGSKITALGFSISVGWELQPARAKGSGCAGQLRYCAVQSPPPFGFGALHTSGWAVWSRSWGS